MVRILTLWLVALVMVGCSRQMPSIGEVALLGAEYPVGGEWPSRVDVVVDVDNAGGKLKLLRGRLRVSYDGRRVVVLTLERKVVVDGRKSEQVILPLKVSVARSSQSLALREALREGNLERIAVDWQLSVRRGVAYAELEQPMRPLGEVLEAAQREQLIEILKSINE